MQWDGSCWDCSFSFFWGLVGQEQISSSLKINPFSKLKDPTPTSQKHSIVYSIPCFSCPLSYIGTTKNKLHIRLQQHKNDCQIKHAFKPQKTALATHHFDTGHVFDFSNTKILDTELNYKRRMVSETLHIRRNINHIVNFKRDGNELNSYNNLLL